MLLPQARFGVRTSAMAVVHQAQVAGNGHSAWGLMQPARVKGQGFIVQELPLPLVSSPSGGRPLLPRSMLAVECLVWNALCGSPCVEQCRLAVPSGVTAGCST